MHAPSTVSTFTEVSGAEKPAAGESSCAELPASASSTMRMRAGTRAARVCIMPGQKHCGAERGAA